MPSLYKRAVVEGESVRAVPLIEVATPKTEAESSLEAVVEARAMEIFNERWKQAEQELVGARERQRTELAAERESVLQEAWEQGYAEGERRAQQEASAKMDEIRKAYTQLEIDRLEFIEHCRLDIIALATEMSRTIIREELQSSPETLSRLVSRAFQELMSRRKVVVFVHPDKLEMVAAYSHLLPPTADGQQVLVRADVTLDQDSFRVEDDLGAVKFDLAEQLKKMGLTLTHD